MAALLDREIGVSTMIGQMQSQKVYRRKKTVLCTAVGKTIYQHELEYFSTWQPSQNGKTVLNLSAIN